MKFKDNPTFGNEFVELFGRLDECDRVENISVYDVFSGVRANSGDYVAEFEAGNASFSVELQGPLGFDGYDNTTIGGVNLGETLEFCAKIVDKTPLFAHVWCRKRGKNEII